MGLSKRMVSLEYLFGLIPSSGVDIAPWICLSEPRVSGLCTSVKTSVQHASLYFAPRMLHVLKFEGETLHQKRL